MAWAVCPSCTAVVADAVVHARTCSALAGWVATLGAAPASEATPGDLWDAPAVLTPPDAPDDATQTRAGQIRAQADAARQAITEQAIPELDAYLALAAPTQAQALAQVRTLTNIVRGLAIATRALIRLAARALDAIDQED